MSEQLLHVVPSWDQVVGRLPHLSLAAAVFLLAIVAATVVALASAARLLYRLHREYAALAAVRTRAEQFRHEARSWDPGVAHALTAKIRPHDALVCERIEALHAIREGGGAIDREALASEARSRLVVRGAMLQYVARTLILFGLAGTLFGLTETVVGLSRYQVPLDRLHEQSPAAARDHPEDLRARLDQLYQVVDTLLGSIQKTLGGMQTAFIASLAAVLCTILLNFAHHTLDNRASRFLSAFEEATTRVLEALFVAPKPGDALEGIAEAVRSGTEQMAGVVESIDDRAELVGRNAQELLIVARALESDRDHLREGTKTLIENQVILRETHDGVERTVKRLADAAEQLSRTDTSLREAVEALKPLADAHVGLREAVEKQGTLQTKLQEAVQSLVTVTVDMFDRRLTGILSQESARFTQGVQDQREALQRLEQSLSQELLLHRAGNDLLQRLLDASNDDDRLSRSDLVTFLQGERETRTVLKEKLASIQEQQGHAFAEAITTIKSALAEHTASTDTIARHLVGILGQEAARFTQGVEGQREAIQRVDQSLSQELLLHRTGNELLQRLLDASNDTDRFSPADLVTFLQGERETGTVLKEKLASIQEQQGHAFAEAITTIKSALAEHTASTDTIAHHLAGILGQEPARFTQGVEGQREAIQRIDQSLSQELLLHRTGNELLQRLLDASNVSDRLSRSELVTLLNAERESAAALHEKLTSTQQRHAEASETASASIKALRTERTNSLQVPRDFVSNLSEMRGSQEPGPELTAVSNDGGETANPPHQEGNNLNDQRLFAERLEALMAAGLEQSQTAVEQQRQIGSTLQRPLEVTTRRSSWHPGEVLKRLRGKWKRRPTRERAV